MTENEWLFMNDLARQENKWLRENETSKNKTVNFLIYILVIIVSILVGLGIKGI